MMPLQGWRLTDSELQVKKSQWELKPVKNEAYADCIPELIEKRRRCLILWFFGSRLGLLGAALPFMTY